jgi:hypothetical protein
MFLTIGWTRHTLHHFFVSGRSLHHDLIGCRRKVDETKGK